MSAVLSPCGLYRYRLSREWAKSPKVAFIMLNPSIADATTDDPTIRRCIGFARATGYGGIEVGNLFALRATDASQLRLAVDPVGPDNDFALAEIIEAGSLMLCAWGNHGAYLQRDRRVLQLLRDAGKVPLCLRMTKAGQPSHPLYLPAHLRPVAMKYLSH